MSQSVTPGTITHGKCGKTWTGLGRAHCPSCHETFSCDSAADRHRIGAFGVDRHCADPGDVGLVASEQPWGRMWSHPSPTNGFDHRMLRDPEFEEPTYDNRVI
jgi:hypothetical protein